MKLHKLRSSIEESEPGKMNVLTKKQRKLQSSIEESELISETFIVPEVFNRYNRP